jgi:hypothetical protein
MLVTFQNSCCLWDMWKNMVLPDRPYSTCALHATHTHTHTLTICYTYCFTVATVVMWTCLTVTFIWTVLSFIWRDTEDTACSTFRRPNTWFSVNKNKELEFQSSNKVSTQPQKSVPTGLYFMLTLPPTFKYADKPRTFHWWFSAARNRDFKEAKTIYWAYQPCISKEHINTVSRMSGTIPLLPLYAFLL